MMTMQIRFAERSGYSPRSLALGAHLAFAAFAIARMSEPDDDDLGAPGIEIAYELASTQTAMSELPPGPESEASAASPPVVEQKTAEKQTDLPKETPVESETPDRLVTIEKTDKPKERARAQGQNDEAFG